MIEHSYWNYRLVRHNGMVGVYEAYYNDDKIWAISADPVDVSFEEDAVEPIVDIMRKSLKWMLEACDKPILEYDSIPEQGATEPDWEKSDWEPICVHCQNEITAEDGVTFSESKTDTEYQECAMCDSLTLYRVKW